MNSPKFFRLLICHLLFITTFLNSFSQAGGPPMLTDDPDVVDFHKWEINISTNPEISDHFELALPYLDINYGVWHNLQLKLETPLIFSDFQKHITSTIGDVIVGVKYRFYENESLLFTAGTYPQWALRGEQGFFVPLLLQKGFGKFLIGSEVGYFWGRDHQNHTNLCALIGFQASDQLQLMAEYFYQSNEQPASSKEGYLNVGLRKKISEKYTFMTSCGTQVVTPPGEPAATFFAWVGFQCSF